MTKYAVVVPTNRPERIEQFIEAWARQFHQANVRLIVVEDAAQWSAKLPEWVEHYCHEDINAELKDKAECIPIRSGGCRDFGFWKAYQDETVDMIVSLDDDVLPLEGLDFLAEHWRALETPRQTKWWPLVPGFRLRGEPYHVHAVKPVLNVGLWQGFPDVDAYGQLNDADCEKTFSQYPICPKESRLIPAGMYYACCGMNFAFRREIAPFAYFPRLPEGMKRFDDIWMGFIFKRIADLFGWAVTCGMPLLKHDRASNPLSNLRQEMLGYGLHEMIVQIIDNAPKAGTPIEQYREIAQAIGEALSPLKESSRLMASWAGLFS